MALTILVIYIVTVVFFWGLFAEYHDADQACFAALFWPLVLIFLLGKLVSKLFD
jgi:hypothetical protein